MAHLLCRCAGRYFVHWTHALCSGHTTDLAAGRNFPGTDSTDVSLLLGLLLSYCPCHSALISSSASGAKLSWSVSESLSLLAWEGISVPSSSSSGNSSFSISSGDNPCRHLPALGTFCCFSVASWFQERQTTSPFWRWPSSRYPLVPSRTIGD